MPSDNFEIKLDKKEIKTTLKDIEDSDYYKRIANQVKKIRTGEINQAFKGNGDKWKEIFHSHTIETYDKLIISVLREEYQEYQKYIEPIKKLINFHNLNIHDS
ncbi:MAG: hypothetical protein EU536_02485 [Promethearchaeota archaeon]|nr:MAG: hypothetical protein EU536_02485 [Candidatus Lokiarchaeota archaeon]